VTVTLVAPFNRTASIAEYAIVAEPRATVPDLAR